METLGLVFTQMRVVPILKGIQTIVNTQNILTDTFLTLSNGTQLTGAGSIEATIKLWGYIIFAVVIVVAAVLSVVYFQKNYCSAL